MKALLRVIRGLVGLGAAGAVAGGSLVAALAALVELFADGTITVSFVGYGFLAGAGLGLVIATAFGGVLAITSRGRRLEDLSYWRAITASGLVGASLPPLLVFLGRGGISPVLGEAPAIVLSGLFGALLGGGLVTIGKEARLKEIEAAGSSGKLLDD